MTSSLKSTDCLAPRGHQSIGRDAFLFSREIHTFIARELEPYGIGSGQFPFLMRLLHNDGISQEVLIRDLNCDRATGTRAINKLEENGYVLRETDPQDKRAYRVCLTDKSRQLGPVIKQMSVLINDIVFDGFTGEEKILFVQMIKRAIGNLSRENDARKAGK
ncbi:MAG: MarR family transcriptional regulator [Methanolobus sp.]|uniref:MarR family winged helix-turn-helix transcriptional regulator n=1 Tax=Methanolobus sp. TaxID=1874737 RepID=UPI00272F058C|nr:MarR family transcriptional regulator [Methanolobus sp.]MDP2216958.1 MarR family transcriptional regulator [Methanolobus sp.]